MEPTVTPIAVHGDHHDLALPFTNGSATSVPNTSSPQVHISTRRPAQMTS